MRYAFHQAAVAHKDVGVVIDDVQTVFIKFGGKDFFCQCHAHCVGNALSQRAGRGFHAVGVAVFGVAGGFAVQLAEVFQVFNAQVVAGQVQQAVQQHGRVAVGEDEAVAVVKFGVGGIVMQEFRPQYFCHFRHAHRRAGVAGICFLNGICGEETDCVCQLRHFISSLLVFWISGWSDGVDYRPIRICFQEKEGQAVRLCRKDICSGYRDIGFSLNVKGVSILLKTKCYKLFIE